MDKEHVQNLAKALLRLIQLSGGQNLQLVIISHDIEFIQLLEQYADSYYEISRDVNRYSTIDKRMIRDIGRKEWGLVKVVKIKIVSDDDFCYFFIMVKVGKEN